VLIGAFGHAASLERRRPLQLIMQTAKAIGIALR